jgi:kinetochore protein Spc25
MKFTFNCVDGKQWDREFSFVLQVNDKSYEITECQPDIEEKNEYLSLLNVERSFGAFLARMRKAFAKQI